MGYVTDILIGAAGSLVAAEIYVHAERMARWLTKKAAARLSSRGLEEWMADLEDMPGAVSCEVGHGGALWVALTSGRATKLGRGR